MAASLTTASCFGSTPTGTRSGARSCPRAGKSSRAPDSPRTATSTCSGRFGATSNLGNGQQLSFAPQLDFLQAAFLAQLAPDGAARWARALPPVGTAFVGTGNLAIDDAGNMVLTGMTENGGVSLAGVAGQDDTGSGDFFAKYAPDGSYLWSRAFPVQVGAGGPPLVAGPIDPSGDVSGAGNFDNTVDFGTGPLTAPGVLTLPGRGAPAPHIPDNVFVLRLAP